MESPSPPAVVVDPAPTDRSTDSGSTGLSDGAWLGIALGIAVALGLIIYLVYRRKRAKEARRESFKSEQSDNSKDLMAVEWPSQAADAEESGVAGSVTATDAVTDASQVRSVISEDASEDYSSVQTGTRGRSSERSYRGYKHEGYAHMD